MGSKGKKKEGKRKERREGGRIQLCMEEKNCKMREVCNSKKNHEHEHKVSLWEHAQKLKKKSVSIIFSNWRQSWLLIVYQITPEKQKKVDIIDT